MTFEVEVVRIGYSNKTLKIEADTKEEAEALALEKAPNLEFCTEHNSEYDVIYSNEIKS